MKGTAMKRIFFGVLPLVILAGFVLFIVLRGPAGLSAKTGIPLENLTITRMTFHPDEIRLSLLNEGPDPVTVAQVMVNGAYWSFSIEPAAPVERLGRASIRIPYPWDEGEAQVITLVSGIGTPFEAETPAATRTPTVTVGTFGTFTLLGVYVGVIPVLMGLLWLPFLRKMSRGAFGFFMALTVGLLVFLAVDTIEGGIEMAGKAPQTVQGIGLFVLGFFAAFLALMAIGGMGKETSALRISFSVALGIGVHNLGEGLAVGSALAVGEAALGTLLVLGFIIHNVTEGFAVIAPLSQERPRLRALAGLGLLAGGPAILGTWIGGFSYIPALSVLFLGVGAGAIVQVVVQIVRQMSTSKARALFSPVNVLGFLVGVVVMYGTGFLVAA